MTNFLFRDPEIVFIHIPKNGGTSVRSAFSDGFVAQAQGIVPEAWLHLPSFAIVRNPIDRFLSAVNMFRIGNRDVARDDDYYAQPRLPDLTVARALDILCDDRIAFNRSMRTNEANLKHHLWPQTDPFNCLAQAKIILRFENLADDFAEMCRQLGAFVELPKRRVTRGGQGAIQPIDITGEEMRRIRAFFRRDFDELGYDRQNNTLQRAGVRKELTTLRDLWRHYFDAVVAPSISLTEALPDHSIDLSLFTRETVQVVRGPTWAGRKRNPLEHFRYLEAEFGGRPRLAHLLACVIVVLRRDKSNARALKLFDRIVTEHGGVVAESLNLRWLTSVCDTLIDVSSSDTDKALAMAGTLFANTIKIVETELRMFYPQRPWPPNARLSRGGPLFDGVISYWIGKGDMIDNLLDRIEIVLRVESPASPFVRQIMNRVIDSNTSITRIFSLQGKEPPMMAPEEKIAALRAAMKEL